MFVFFAHFHDIDFEERRETLELCTSPFADSTASGSQFWDDGDSIVEDWSAAEYCLTGIYHTLWCTHLVGSMKISKLRPGSNLEICLHPTWNRGIVLGINLEIPFFLVSSRGRTQEQFCTIRAWILHVQSDHHLFSFQSSLTLPSTDPLCRWMFSTEP